MERTGAMRQWRMFSTGRSVVETNTSLLAAELLTMDQNSTLFWRSIEYSNSYEDWLKDIN